jgi:5'(3')-deoxyribonucleotidase
VGVSSVQRLLQGSDQVTAERDLTVGIDLDGILADQITGVIPRIRHRLGIDLSYEDISEFRLPVGPSSDIAKEIVLAQADSAYLLEMPVNPGAHDLVEALRRRFRVILITARPESSLALTQRWLDTNGFRFDQVINAKESRKSIYGADVLIDDYTGNVVDFVAHTSGLAILVDRPWNRRDRLELNEELQKGRVVIAKSLAAVSGLLDATLADDSRSSNHGNAGARTDTPD